jgi:hypothetical protein
MSLFDVMFYLRQRDGVQLQNCPRVCLAPSKSNSAEMLIDRAFHGNCSSVPWSPVRVWLRKGAQLRKVVSKPRSFQNRKLIC